jgi:hypothetical protein
MDRVGALDNFFDLGGNSLLLMRVFAALEKGSAGALTVASMFADPAPRGIGKVLDGHLAARRTSNGPSSPQGIVTNEPVAIVGMACRLPGAADLEAFWRMLDEGR